MQQKWECLSLVKSYLPFKLYILKLIKREDHHIMNLIKQIKLGEFCFFSYTGSKIDNNIYIVHACVIHY